MRSAASFIHPRDEILQAIQRIYRYRMTTTSGGNLSIREDNGDIWITPARLDKGSLRRDDIVCVRADGTVEGPHRPSSELPFHQEIYRTRRDIHGIVHAHPVALVAFSLVHRIPDTHLFHQTRTGLRRGRFCALRTAGQPSAWGAMSPPSSDRASIASCWRITARSPAAPTCRRPSAASRLSNSRPRRSSKPRMLGDVRYLTDDEIALARGAAPEWTRVSATRPGTHEKELRTRLAEFVRRAYRQRLFISTQGSFSARVDETSFPDHALPAGPRHPRCSRPGAGAQRRVRSRRASPAAPRACMTRSTGRHPEMGAIINAYPVNATAFSVTGVPLDSRTIPESYIVIREVSRFPYGLQFSDTAALAAAISPRRPAAHTRERRRAGHRQRHSGSFRPAGSSGIHRRGHH